MILPFITDSLKRDPSPENLPEAGVNTGNGDVKLLAENSGESSDELIPREDSFEVKYKTLLDKIEKERFERELLAGNR